MKQSATFFYGWVVVASAFCIMFTSYGVQFSFGIFFPTLINEFGWTRGALAGVFSLYALIYSACSPLMGKWTDVYGPKKVILLGALLMGCGMGAVSRTQAIWHLYFFYGIVAALGMSTVYVSLSSTVVRWFVKRRGLAIGIAQAGNGFGIITMTLISQNLLTTLGWRNAYLFLGIMVFLVFALGAPLLKRDPEALGLNPDGRSSSREQGNEDEGDAASSRSFDYSAPEAMRTRSFWLLLLSFIFCFFFLFVPFVHLIMIGIEAGIERPRVIFAASLIGIAAIFGRFGMGAISDWIGRKKSLIICIGLQALSWIWIIYVGEASWMIKLFALTFGFSYGGISSMLPAIVGDFFGRSHAGSITGIVFGVAGMCTALGPVISGGIADRMGSYRLAFLLALLANVASLLTISFTPPPPKRR